MVDIEDIGERQERKEKKLQYTFEYGVVICFPDMGHCVLEGLYEDLRKAKETLRGLQKMCEGISTLSDCGRKLKFNYNNCGMVCVIVPRKRLLKMGNIMSGILTIRNNAPKGMVDG